MVPLARASLALAVVLCALTARAGESSPDLRRFAAQSRAVSLCEDLLARGEHGRALASVLRMEKDLPPTFRPRIDHIAAACYLKAGAPDRALDRLKTYVEDRSEFRPEWWECYTLAARARAAKGELCPALVLYSWLGERSSGAHKALAAEGCARILEKMRDYDRAAAAYKYALDYLRRTLQEYEHDTSLERRLREGSGRVSRLRDVSQYGEGFVAYRDAERLRLAARDHARALMAYRDVEKRFPGTVWAEAARMYSGYCLLALDRIDEARATWVRFFNDDNWGFYRGEALLGLAMIALNESLDPAAAETCLESLTRWLDTVEETGNFVLPEIESRSAGVTRPPDTEYRKNGFGYLRPARDVPGELRNRATCRWHLRWLRKQLVLASGFRLVLNRDGKTAREHFAALIKLDDLTAFIETNDGPSATTRLVGAAESGHINCEELEMAGLSSRGRVAALLGDYWFAALERDYARRVYRNLADGRFRGMNLKDRAYGVFGLGHCAYVAGDYDGAVRHLSRFEGELARTPVAPQALFTLGQSLYMPFNYSQQKDQVLRERWEAVFRKAATLAEGTFWSEYARFRLGMIYALSASRRESGQQILRETVLRCRFARADDTRSLAGLAEMLLDISRSGDRVYPIE